MKNLFLVFAIVVSTGCIKEKTEQVPVKKDATASIPASILDEPKSTAANQVLTMQGVIDLPPNQQVSIQPYFEGFISDIKVIEGSKVKKGELLFKLTNPDFIATQEDYLMDKATVAYLEKVLERAKKLHSEKVTPDQDLQEIEMNFRIAKANLEAANRTLKLMNLSPDKISSNQLFESINIYAPISGYVTGLMVNSGMFIQRGNQVANIINTDHMHLELRIFEKDLIKIKEGQSLAFRIPEMGDQIHKAEIYLIGKSIDPQTRMIQVHAHPNNEELNLLPGMFVEAQIELTEMGLTNKL